jgi:hypothetical protein
MLISIMLAASAAVQAPTVTVEQVATLPPAELGQRILGSTRLPIVEAFRYQEHLEPPTPRGKPTVIRVVLYEQASDSGEEGFCQKVRYMVRLKPAIADANGHLPLAPTALVTPSTLYRWKTTDGSGPACEGEGHDFLSVSDSDAKAVFAVIRLLAKVQNVAPDHLPPQLTGTVDDQVGRDGFYAAGEAGPITDWRTALSDFPVSKIRAHRRGEPTNLGLNWSFRAGEWTVDVTYAVGRITHLSFRRFEQGPS